MPMKEALDAITKRLMKPENTARYAEAANNSSRICWHYERAKESLECIQNANTSNANLRLLESDFSVSIKEINRMLDEEGWA